MGATLDALHRLQAIETELFTLRQGRRAKRREVEVHTARLAKIQEEGQAHQEKNTQLLAEIDRLELDRSSREERIADRREKMKVTRTNKEYTEIRKEINTLDADNRKLEDRILSLMTQVDDLKVEGEAIKERMESQQERIARHQAELAEHEATTTPQVEALEARREEAADSVPATAMEIFRRIADYNESEAMAQIAKPNAKRDEYICGGCQMSIPLQAVNALMTTGDEVQTCPVCGRILYLEAPAATDQAATS